MLKTERNTKTMGRRVLAAFLAAFDYTHADRYADSHFEHGQWWITTENGAIYSVQDAAGRGSTDGFCFEQVAEGEEL